jgi:hypothetical protein
MLPSRQKGLPGQNVRVPQWQLPVAQRIHNKAFPGVIFQIEIAEQVVVGALPRCAALLANGSQTKTLSAGSMSCPL